MPCVLFFLRLDDLHRVSATCRAWHVKCFPYRKALLRKWGIAPERRLRYWSWCAGVDLLFRSEAVLVSEYVRCLGAISGLASLSAIGTEGEIARDVVRTFQRLAFFNERDSQNSLANILKAVSVYASVVGYCQGMNYVAAILLVESDAKESARVREARVFGLLCGFIVNLDMKDLWRPGVPQLKLRIFQFDRLLQQTEPHLAAHFKHIGLNPDFFASQWFLTLLSYNVPAEQLVRVWDLLLTDGWKTIFRVGIAILQSIEPTLVTLSLEETSTFFKNGHMTRINADLVFASAKIKTVKTKALLELENLYVAHVLAQQLSDAPDIHGAVAFVDRRIAALVRQEIARLDGPVRADVSVLRNRIEQTERALKEARAVFILEAREFVEVQADVEELQEAKRAISSQIIQLASTSDDEHDLPLMQAKVEAIDAQLLKESARFGGVLWRTSQAQVDLEEALERKAVFSEQLRLVLDHNEASRVERIKTLFRELNVARCFL